MNDPTSRDEFTYQGKTYRVSQRDAHWTVTGDNLTGTGTTLIDAMEAVFGPLHSHELTRIAVHLLSHPD